MALPKGERPFRLYIDPAQDGAEEVFRIGDRIRREFYRTVGFEDLLNRPERNDAGPFRAGVVLAYKPAKKAQLCSAANPVTT